METHITTLEGGNTIIDRLKASICHFVIDLKYLQKIKSFKIFIIQNEVYQTLKY